MKSKVRLILVGLGLGVLAGVSVRQAHADQDSDLHRIMLATESIAKHLESIDRNLERCPR